MILYIFVVLTDLKCELQFPTNVPFNVVEFMCSPAEYMGVCLMHNSCFYLDVSCIPNSETVLLVLKNRL